MHARRRQLPGLASIAALWMAAAFAHAANLQVAPTMVKVPAERAAEGLTLSNSGDVVLHAQVRVFQWLQRDGEDVLVPTQDIAISPPMLEVQGGGTQLVRIVRLGPPPQDGIEASYRLLVDELPIDLPPEQGAGLRFVLQYSIPVFLSPPGSVAVSPRLQARLRDEGDRRTLELANEGNGHAQIVDLAYVSPEGVRINIAHGLAGYVLPGNRRQWPLPDGISSTDGGTFTARVNGDADERTLAIDAPLHH
ncbi:MAG: fimbria/pilus periplasmic chaperone [Luteimonas sp.]|nr:fimbria/pilus periplasmic chaperone [Luteimonas sp.]